MAGLQNLSFPFQSFQITYFAKAVVKSCSFLQRCKKIVSKKIFLLNIDNFLVEIRKNVFYLSYFNKYWTNITNNYASCVGDTFLTATQVKKALLNCKIMHLKIPWKRCWIVYRRNYMQSNPCLCESKSEGFIPYSIVSFAIISHN